jgi:hypothetical protein
MPVLTRWYVKASLLYLVAALWIALCQAAGSVWQLPAFVNALGPVYFHFFLVGWATQLIFGIAFWMFPRYSLEKPHGNENLAWLTFWLLNGGLSLRAVAEPVVSLTGANGWGWLLAGSALTQWIAGLLFIANTWPRVRGR